jgi:hypothetical protein
MVWLISIGELNWMNRLDVGMHMRLLSIHILLITISNGERHGICHRGKLSW